MKKKLLLTSILSIIMCVSLIVGATFALFTSQDEVNITATSGKVSVLATVKDGSITTKSFGKIISKDVSEGVFENAGTAKFTAEDKLALDFLTPGDEVSFVIDVENKSTVKIKYRVEMFISGGLAPALVGSAVINGKEYVIKTMATDWITVEANTAINDITVKVAFPDADNNNAFQEKTADVSFTLVAVQGNGSDSYVTNASTAEDLETAILMGGNISLTNNIDLGGETYIVPTGTEVNIDLNGNTLIGNIVTEAGANVVIGDSNTATLYSLKRAITPDIIGTINNAEGATMTIKNVVIANNVVNGGSTIVNNGTLVLDGATIIGAPIADGGYPEYAVFNYANLTIEEGTTIIGDAGCVKIDKVGKTVINGGTFIHNDISPRSLTTHVIYNYKTSENALVINGGYFEHGYLTTSGGVVVNNRSAITVEVNGGTFVGGNYYGIWDNLSDYGSGKTKKPFAVKGGTFTGFDKKFLAEGYMLKDNADGTYTVVKQPKGIVNSAFTSETGFWGDWGGNPSESFEIKIYSGDTYLGSSSLNNVGGIIDGDVYVTWSLYLDVDAHQDEYWTQTWVQRPTKDLLPTKAVLYVDGYNVGESAVQLNGPDGICKITSAVYDANGVIVKFFINIEDASNYVKENQGKGYTVMLLRDVDLNGPIVIA